MRLNKDKLINLALSNGILVAIIILIIITGIIQPEFFAWSNMINILRQISVNGIVACGMTVCIMSGCYDLSVGSIVSMTGVFAILAVNAGYPDLICIGIGLGFTIALRMQASEFLVPETLLILGLGLIAFIMDTAGGVLFAKVLNLFLKTMINPMIGAAGISAFPMSGRIVHKMGLKEDPQNFLLMHSIGVNVSGQIASVIAGGLILKFFM